MKSAFRTTRWTLVVRAAGQDSPERTAALSELLSQNWYPLYAFLRRSGKPAAEVEDLIQGFCLRILEKDLFAGIDRYRKGRFRNFLLACLKNYVANQWQHDQAIKRGGAKQRLSLDLQGADQRYQIEPAHTLTPQLAYDRDWAIELINRSLQEVSLHWHQSGKGKKFEGLKGYLLHSETSPQGEVAATLEMTTSALKVAIHRLRAEFRSALCRQVAETLDRDDLLEDEINWLFSALNV